MAALIVSLIAFYFFHSLLAAEKVKAWAHRKLGLQRWYRAVYVIITFVLLALVVISFISIEAEVLIGMPAALHILGIFLLVIGILLARFVSGTVNAHLGWRGQWHTGK